MDEETVEGRADGGAGAGTGAGAGADRGRPCPACDAPMRRRHCKYVCPNHGVVYDCSDTFW
jgi:hypothetical protein